MQRASTLTLCSRCDSSTGVPRLSDRAGEHRDADEDAARVTPAGEMRALSSSGRASPFPTPRDAAVRTETGSIGCGLQL